MNDKTLQLGVDFELRYENNVNAGTATVILIGKGEYVGETPRSFTIMPKRLYDANVKVDVPVQTYTGGALTPDPVVTVDGRVLQLGKGLSSQLRE